MKKLIFTLFVSFGLFATPNLNAQCGVQCAGEIPILGCSPGALIVAGGCVYACLDPVNIGFSCVLTPVEISQFEGVTSDNKVALKWTTESEENNDYFLVSRSFDGVNFRDIGQVNGAGTTSEQQTYTFEDRSIFSRATSNNAYYKLEQVDTDGSVLNEVGVISVELSPEKVLNIQNVLGVTTDEPVVLFSAPVTGQYALQMLDVTGRVLLSTEISAEQGYNQIQLTTPGLSNGMYLISISNGRQNVTHKIMR